ncbi:3347_t:CDS:2 [Paraglomus occultum]|uniref:3347_t:CDS:1 n=1 Tax=Paraglomus occultum TaxID=144539 RepID=A0A9N9FMF5_9GLOM|nr:3347_t:CDS:2 [Paraglomus occultum]
MDEHPYESTLHPGMDRRGSTWSNVIDSPADWATSFSEDYEGMAWVKLSTKLSCMAAGMLNSAFLLIKYLHSFEYSISPHYQKKEYQRTTLSSWLTLAEMALVAISLLNAVLVVLPTKSYRMFLHDKNSPPQSSHAYLVDRDVMFARGVKECVRVAMNKLRIKKSHEEEEEDVVWELRIWNPWQFNWNLFMLFSPVQSFVLYGVNEDNYHFMIPLAASACLQLCFLVHLYNGYTRDRKALYEEVAYEYDKQFVYPNVVKIRAEKQIQTEEEQPWDKFNIISSSSERHDIMRRLEHKNRKQSTGL